MQTFNEVMDYIEEQISELTPNQIHILTRKIVDDFLQKLPKDWEKTELEIEQPIYLKLADLLKEPTWDFEAINQQTQVLDDIMLNMDDDYPADTDFLPITVLNITTFLQSFSDNPTDEIENQDLLIGLVEEYMNTADYFSNITGGISLDNDKWLTYPLIKQAFDQLITWMNDIKNI